MTQQHTEADKLAGSMVRMIVERLEEKEAVLASLEAGWDSDLMTNAQRRRIVSDVRRFLVDMVCDLESLRPR